jgi:hypothetical protein
MREILASRKEGGLDNAEKEKSPVSVLLIALIARCYNEKLR